MGLPPQYYDGCTDDVLNLYAELEDRIIADIARRIVKTGDVTETAKWQIRQAQQAGLVYDDIVKTIANFTDKTDEEVKRMFEDAGVETVQNDNRIHIQGGASPLDIRQSESMLQILQSVYDDSLTSLNNLTGTTAVTSQTAYLNACNSAFMMVSSGAFSYQQALKTVLSEVAEKGATVTYPSGHTDRLDVAVRRSLLTGIGLASRQIGEENSKLCGCDLMEISAHSGARPSHAAWQGKIVSLSGRKGYLSKSDIGYGTGAGFGGWNCRHDWYPFYEGISVPNYSQNELDNLNAKDIEYNGKLYTEYEISQMLRQKERQARALKREKVALKAAIEEGQDYLKDDLKAVNGKIRTKSKEIEDFCRDTGYQRDRFREQVGGKTSVGHTSNNKSSPNDLTSKQNSGNMDIEDASNSHDRNYQLEGLIKRAINSEHPIFADNLVPFVSKTIQKNKEDYYIVSLHGDYNKAWLWGTEITPSILKNIIKAREDYNGEDILLISCNTGNTTRTENCFAQLLADELNVPVKAPTRFGLIKQNGDYYSGLTNGKREGDFIVFTPRKKD